MTLLYPTAKVLQKKAVNEAVEMNRAYLEGGKYIVFLNATAACKCNEILAQIIALESAPLRGVQSALGSPGRGCWCARQGCSGSAARAPPAVHRAAAAWGLQVRARGPRRLRGRAAGAAQAPRSQPAHMTGAAWLGGRASVPETRPPSGPPQLGPGRKGLEQPHRRPERPSTLLLPRSLAFILQRGRGSGPGAGWEKPREPPSLPGPGHTRESAWNELRARDGVLSARPDA